jgi:Zn-finger protein
MEHSNRWFSNKACKYYPCHDMDSMNCLFCFCPLYHYDCKGDFVHTSDGIKDCSECKIPHVDKGFDYIIKFIMKINEKKKKEKN